MEDSNNNNLILCPACNRWLAKYYFYYEHKGEDNKICKKCKVLSNKTEDKEKLEKINSDKSLKSDKRCLKRWYLKNKDKVALQYHDKYFEITENGLPAGFEKSLMKNYGITGKEYKDKLLFQENSCAICKTPFSEEYKNRERHLDHCHSTGKIRGILCHNCNRGIGSFKDNTDVIRNAAEYLIRWSS